MVETVIGSEREPGGKGAARRARRAGRIPGIIYGSGKTPVALEIEKRTLAQALGDPRFFIRLIDIEVAGTKHRVLPRDVQFHPVSDQPLHVDFLRFDPDRKISVAVPMRFENDRESIGIKRGGILNIVRHEVELYCTADKIPPELVADLDGLDIGDSIHASHVTLPEDTAFVITDRDFTIATIAAPSILTETTEEEEEEIEGEGEGEETEEAAEEADTGSGD